jgi:undecaprenyl diphosphate synthase
MDYSSRDAMLRASAQMRGEHVTREAFTEALARVDHDAVPGREVDLVVRTGGEQRLSDFLLWESAYAELLFVEKMWPEFKGDDLAEALADFRSRNRRFGLAPEQVAS